MTKETRTFERDGVQTVKIEITADPIMMAAAWVSMDTGLPKYHVFGPFTSLDDARQLADAIGNGASAILSKSREKIAELNGQLAEIAQCEARLAAL